MLADTERGLSGTQIERLLQEIEVADTSPGMTKWKRLFNALAGAHNLHQIGNHLTRHFGGLDLTTANRSSFAALSFRSPSSMSASTCKPTRTTSL